MLNIVKELWLLIIFYIKPESDLVIFGGGHAATLTVRAAKKNLVKPTAIAAVAPTWAGPLPIVFGRDSSMETRYGECHFTFDIDCFFLDGKCCACFDWLLCAEW